jgi:hypothetical protein
MTETAYPRNAEGLNYKKKTAINLMVEGQFPDWWCFVPVSGKATYVQEWTTKPLPKDKLIEIYRSKTSYTGLGVVTGEFSGGLISLDLDGHSADGRYKVAAGDGYEAFGQESTMSWTSGKPGRRQVLYRVPAFMVPELRHVKTVILREDGEWHLGQGDTNRKPGGQESKDGTPYEEVVLRFNSCQSVLPGSPHPDKGCFYTFLNYNNKQVELAPEWILEVLRNVRKPLQFFSDEDTHALDQETAPTMVPSRQIRGWFFKEEVQEKLRPRLADLVFNHPVFDEYGWHLRDGSKPQAVSGCPWHGGTSGTSFQYSTESGCWDCKACGVGGDVLDFVHKIRSKDIYATRPMGTALEGIVAEIAVELGYDYPACADAKEVTVKTEPTRRLTGAEFFQHAQNILDTHENSELAYYLLSELARDAGMSHVFRSGPQIEAAVERWITNQQVMETPEDWQERARGMRNYLIPDFLSAPSSVLLHARGGLGKTRLAVLIARVVGQQQPMKIRGLTVAPTLPEGRNNVLFIGSDMSEADYAEYLDQQGIDSSAADKWFHYKSNWQQTQYRQLLKWLKEIQPALVVVDSLTSVSTMIAAKENEREYSNTMYRLARENGTQFPPTTFLWIHHDTKGGDTFRGTDTIRNAVHETWHLEELSDEERAQHGDATVLTIEKSRGRRSGDRFLLREDLEEVLSLEDLTPTVQRSNRGLGDETPRTLVLGFLRDSEEGMTMKELKFQLDAALSGRQGAKPLNRTTVERWVKGWKASGLVEEVGVRQPGERGGPGEKVFKTAPPYYETNLAHNPPPFFESHSTAVDPEDGVMGTHLHITPDAHNSNHNDTVVSAENRETQHGSSPEDGELTETAEAPETPSEGGVMCNPSAETTMHITPENETLSSTGISENTEGVMCNGSLVKESLAQENTPARLPDWWGDDYDQDWSSGARPEGEPRQD